MASWRWASGGFPVGAVCHRLGEYGFALPVGGVPQGDSHDKRKLLTLLIKDPPIPYAEISAELGIAVGSIGPTRRRCLDKLRRQPTIAELINTETQTA